MAAIQGRTSVGNDGVLTVIWEGIADGDSGSPVSVAGFPVKTIQAVGTFGSASIALEGSNDGETWAAVNDADGTPIAMTDDTLYLIRENPAYLRLVESSATGTTDLDVIITGAQTGVILVAQ